MAEQTFTGEIGGTAQTVERRTIDCKRLKPRMGDDFLAGPWRLGGLGIAFDERARSGDPCGR